MARKRVAVLISGRGTNMAALIAAAKDKSYPAEIAVVMSNRPDAAGLAYAKDNGIATAVVDHGPFGKDRQAFERALQAALDAHRIDIVCLAGFMRLLTADFARRWQGRMLNIHPSLLPAFKGLDTHERALAAGAKIHGATVHFVAPEMDSGPIVAQAAVPVMDDDTAETLAARVLTGRAQDLSAGLAAGRRRTRADRRWPLSDFRRRPSRRRAYRSPRRRMMSRRQADRGVSHASAQLAAFRNTPPVTRRRPPRPAGAFASRHNRTRSRRWRRRPRRY